MGRRQRGRGFRDVLAKGANLAREGLAAAEDAGIEIPDQNPFAGLSNASTQAPGMMAALQTPAPPPQESQDFNQLLAAAKTMTPDDVDKVRKLAQAKALLTEAQEGARRSTRSKPRHKRRAKTRRLKASKKRTGRSNRP